jgi:glucokinase
MTADFSGSAFSRVEQTSSNGGEGRFLLADIGGTNARFALLKGGRLGEIEHIPVADYPNVGDAIAAFLSRQTPQPAVATVVLAIAAPVAGDRCTITNSRWVIDGAELRAAFQFSTVRLINDFEAVALSLPQLIEADLFSIGGGKAQFGEPMLVLGPGTGFGAAALVWRNGQAFPIATEGGHSTLPSSSRREDAIIEHLRQRFGHVSIERAVSGPGLENLYRGIATLDGLSVPMRNPTEITQAGFQGDCAASRMALETFCAMLGTVAGDFALTFRTLGGVYIAGGIAPRITNFLARSEFRARFEAKGRFRSYLERIPTRIIIHPDVTFLGLKALAENMEKVAH